MFIQDFQYTSDYSISFDCPDGEHTVKIIEAKETTTKNGAPMIEVQLAVQDSNGIAYIERIVSGEYFNKNMSRFFDAFKIVRGNFAFMGWRGKIGRGMFKHEQQTFTGADGIPKTVNKAVMKALLVEQSNTQGTPQAQNTQPRQTQQSYQQSQGNTAPQQSQQSASPSVDDFPEDIPF